MARQHQLLVGPRSDRRRNIETNPEYRVCLFMTTVPVAVWLFFCRRPKRTTDDDATTTTQDTTPASYAIARPILPRARHVGDGHCGAVALVAGRVARRVPRREAQGGIQTEATHRCDGLCVGMRVAPTGARPLSSGSVIILSTPRRLRAPVRAYSMTYPNK